MSTEKMTEKEKISLVRTVVFVGVGLFIGMKIQKKIDIRTFNKRMKDVQVLTKELAPMFPETMSLAEIKEILSKIEGAKFWDALITSVNGVEHLIIR